MQLPYSILGFDVRSECSLSVSHIQIVLRLEPRAMQRPLLAVLDFSLRFVSLISHASLQQFYAHASRRRTRAESSWVAMTPLLHADLKLNEPGRGADARRNVCKDANGFPCVACGHPCNVVPRRGQDDYFGLHMSERFKYVFLRGTLLVKRLQRVRNGGFGAMNMLQGS